jgi:hypothetical protein
MPIASILTVTTPADTHLLTQKETVRSLLGLDADKDDQLQILIGFASTAVESYCNRVFAQQIYSEQFRVWTDPRLRATRRGESILRLTAMPVIATGLTVTENGTLLVQGTDFEIDYETGELTRLDSAIVVPPTTWPCWWPSGLIVVTYTAGYLLSADAGRNLPGDIEEATIDIVRTRYLAPPPGVRSESTPDVYSVTYFSAADNPGGLTLRAIALLDQYREVAVA